MSWRPSAWNALETLSGPIAQLALGAWMIRVGGLAVYGEWAWAVAVLNLAALAGFAVTPGLSLQVQAGENAGEARAWLLAGVLAAAPIAGLVPLPVAFAFAAEAQVGVLAALALHAACNAVSLLASAALHGLDRRAYAAFATLTLRIVAASLVGVAALRGASLTVLLLVSGAASALQALVLCLPLLRAPARTGGPTLRRRSSMLLHGARWQWIKSVGSLLYGAGDRILVGHLLGPAALGVYSICVMLADPLVRLVATLSQPLLLWAGRQHPGALAAHSRAFVAIEAAILVAGAFAALLVPALLPIWFGANAAAHVAAVQLAIAGATIAALHPLVNHLLAGRRRQRDFALATLFGGAATLMAMVIAAAFGLEAVIACRLLYGLAQFGGWPALHRVARAG